MSTEEKGRPRHGAASPTDQNHATENVAHDRPAVDLDEAIPAELRAIDRWFPYRLKRRKDKLDKIPQNRDDMDGDAGSPESWHTLDQALAAAPENGGVGFCFQAAEDGIAGVDLDGCHDPETGELAEWAREIVADFASYTEVSPSGTGVHVIARVDDFTRDFLPGLFGRRKRRVPLPGLDPVGGKEPAVEVFSGWWFTMTGDAVPGSPPDLRDAGSTCSAWFRLAERMGVAHGEQEPGAPKAPPEPLDPEDLAWERARLASALSRVPNGDYETWIEVGMAIRGFFGVNGLPDDEGLALYDAWSHGADGAAPAEFSDYSAEQVTEKWASFADGSDAALVGVTVATIYWLARQSGKWKDPGDYRTPAKDAFADYLDEEDGMKDDADQAQARPDIVMDPGRLSQVVDAAEAALLTSRASIYQRGGPLVRPVRLDKVTVEDGVTRQAGALMLVGVSQSWLLEEMQKAADWFAIGKGGRHRAADPKEIYPRTLLARTGQYRFPHLRGVGTTPIITMDGRLIQEPGYDPESGLLLDFEPGAFPLVPESPTRADAEAALAKLASPFREYRFAVPESEDGAGARPSEEKTPSLSVALSGMFVAVVRPAMRLAPLHGYDASSPGSGKTKLIECASTLATGVTPATMAQGADEEEDEKRLTMCLSAGDATILLDNCTRAVRGGFLNMMLTSEIVTARTFGRNDASAKLRLPSTAFVCATGNNLTIAGDMVRRAVVCRIEPGEERPDKRKFDFDPVDEVRETRAELVAAVLTVLRAYHVARRPGKLETFGSYPEYDFVRGALVWLGHADPATTREALFEDDPERGDLAGVMDAWEAEFGDEPIEVGKIKADDFGGPRSTLVARLVGASGSTSWNSRSVGWWLRRHKGQIHRGRQFAPRKSKGGDTYWRLRGGVKPKPQEEAQLREEVLS